MAISINVLAGSFRSAHLSSRGFKNLLELKKNQRIRITQEKLEKKNEKNI